jgi:pilus assembly protein CpaE
VSDHADVAPQTEQPSAAPPAMVYVLDKDSEGVIRQCLNGLGITSPYFGSGGIAGAIADFTRRGSPPLLIVDISGTDDITSALRELSEVCEPSTGVIVIGQDNDIILYRDLKALGVAEYFFKPLVSNLVTRACHAVLTGAPGERAMRTGKLVLVIGVRGGAGATTIATRLAWHLSQVRKRRVMFVDFDLRCGDASLQLDVKAQRALREALEHPERVDDLFLERGVTRVTERLNLLASLEPLDSVITYNEDSVVTLISALLRNYRYVFADLPTERAALLPHILHLPCICLLISDASLASARDISRWRALIGPNGAERMTLHILNKGNARGALPTDEFIRATGAAPDLVIGYEKDVAATANLGIGEVEKCQGFFQALSPILQIISGEPITTKQSFFSRVFG